MLGHAAGTTIAAAFALGANGFLLPPGVNSQDFSLSFDLAAKGVKRQTVRVPCLECQFLTKEDYNGKTDTVAGEGEGSGSGDGPNDLLLNFTISDGGDRLELGGTTIFPPLTDAFPNVQQARTADASVKVPLGVTSSGMQMKEGMRVSEDDGENSLDFVEYQILGLEKQFVDVPAVNIKLLNAEESFYILSIDVDDKYEIPHLPFRHGPIGRPHHGPPPPPPHGPPPEMTNEKECDMLPAAVCRFKATLQAKIAHMRQGKPCPGPHGHFGPPHGRLPSHIRPPLPHLAVHGQHRPHFHHGPHHGRPWHAHHNSQHHWFGAFVQGFVTVLVPVVAGIFVGLAVSMLGLVVGRLITYLWLRYTRSGQGAEGRSQDSDYADQGKGLMLADEEEQLPAYEDAPAYETTEKLSY